MAVLLAALAISHGTAGTAPAAAFSLSTSAGSRGALKYGQLPCHRASHRICRAMGDELTLTLTKRLVRPTRPGVLPLGSRT